MSNIQLTLVPTSENFQLLDIFIGGNGIADYRDLAQLQLPELDCTKGVILNGRAPIWLFAYLAHKCHPTAWVAVMDPRQGAIVVEAHLPDAPAEGSLIALDVIKPYLPKPAPKTEEPGPAEKNKPPPAGNRVIAFVGPPHSGKSVLLCALYRALQRHLPVAEFQRDVFLVRACPDGEGNWFCDVPPDLAMTLRAKNQWDDDFAASVCQNLATLATTKRLLLVDLGGRIDKRNHQILTHCTHAVIVSRDPAAVAEWRGALQSSEVKLLAEVESVWEERCEIVSQEPLRLRLGRLERGREVTALPAELVEAIK